MKNNKEKALDAFCAAGPSFRKVAIRCRATLLQLEKLGKRLEKNLKLLEGRREDLKEKRQAAG